MKTSLALTAVFEFMFATVRVKTPGGTTAGTVYIGAWREERSALSCSWSCLPAVVKSRRENWSDSFVEGLMKSKHRAVINDEYIKYPSF